MSKRRYSLSDIIFSAICTILVIGFLIIFLYPILYVIVSSISTVSMRQGLSLIPTHVSFEGYKAVFENDDVWRGLINSIKYTFIGTSISLILSILVAYVLSQPKFYMGKGVTLFFVITLYFNGGMIPTYLLVKNLGLLNSMWALILPSAISVYNVFLLRAHFTTKVPEELFDAARVDGCGHWRFLAYFTIPISKSIITVIALLYAVSYWNSYFNATLYITDEKLLPLANVLNNILIKNKTNAMDSGILTSTMDVSTIERMQLLDYSLVVVSTIPIFIIIFFIRKALRDVNYWSNPMKNNNKTNKDEKGKGEKL